jgi:hypothetical protein
MKISGIITKLNGDLALAAATTSLLLYAPIITSRSRKKLLNNNVISQKAINFDTEIHQKCPESSGKL